MTRGDKSALTWLEHLAAVCLLLLVRSPERAHRSQCKNNLRQIGIAN